MPKLPQVKPRQVEKVLTKLGFSPRTTKSSHQAFVHLDGRRTVVSMHNQTIPKGTLKAILNQAKITTEEFLRLL